MKGMREVAIDRLEMAFNMYFTLFGESFPTMMAPRDEDEQYKIIMNCLEKKTDYETLYKVDLSLDIKY